MKLVELILEKYKPLSLSSIETFRYRPEYPWQLILGTNGSGKSSILRALAPTVTDKNEFRKGGKKITRWLGEDGTQYELASVYKGTPHHSFIKDGEELNSGGTAKVQNELVERHFNYTKWLHDLLTQNLAFTKLGSRLREKVLIDISNVDFDYALSIYEKCREINRDTVGAIKHVHVKYEELTQRLLQITDIENVQSRIAALESESLKLQPYVDQRATGASGDLALLKQLKQGIEGDAKRLKTLQRGLLEAMGRRKVMAETYGSYEAFQAEIHRLQGQGTQLSTQVEQTESEIASIEKLVHRLEENPDTVDRETLEESLLLLRRKEENLTANVSFTFGGDLNNALEGLYALHSELVTIGNEKPRDVTYPTKEQREAVTKRLRQAQQLFNDRSVRLNRTRANLDSAMAAKKNAITCPKCDAQFSPIEDISEGTIRLYKEQITDLEKELGVFDKELEICTAEDEAHQLLQSFVIRVKDTVLAHTGLSELLAAHGNPITFVNSPFVALDTLSGLIEDIKTLQEIAGVKKAIQEGEELLYLLKLSTTDVRSRYKELTEKYEVMVAEKIAIGQRIDGYQDVAREWEKIVNIYQQLEKTIEAYCRLMVKSEEKSIVMSLNERLLSVQSELAVAQKNIRQWEDLNQRKAFLEKETEELQVRKNASDLLLKALSPKEGVICRALRKSLTAFCEVVNSVIEEVWEHDFYLRLPNEENISFNFEMVVNGEVRDEISKGSAGEQDMINMAATLVIMKQKGLQNYPLFMDEVGSTFDYAHRKNLLDLIRKLITGGSISQLFMVNHFSAEYGGVNECDVVVLNSDNIQLTSAYNEVVEFTH